MRDMTSDLIADILARSDRNQTHDGRNGLMHERSTVSSTDKSNHVTVSVPARTDFLQLLRLNIAGIAADAFSIDEVEDLKIAIEEFAALVMALPEAGDHLDVRFDLTDDRLVVTGERQWTAVGVIDPGDFLATILDAMVDRHALEPDRDAARFVFEKMRRER